jgi:hypothetical protein
MRQFASRYQRLSVQDAGSRIWSTSGLPQHVAIVVVAEGGSLHDPGGCLRVAAVRQELDRRLQLVSRLRHRVPYPGWARAAAVAGWAIPPSWPPRRTPLRRQAAPPAWRLGAPGGRRIEATYRR